MYREEDDYQYKKTLWTDDLVRNMDTEEIFLRLHQFGVPVKREELMDEF